MIIFFTESFIISNPANTACAADSVRAKTKLKGLQQRLLQPSFFETPYKTFACPALRN